VKNNGVRGANTLKAEFRLYGDDFDQGAIRQWFAEEAAYHNQFAGGRFEEHPMLYQVFDWHCAFEPYFHPASSMRVLDFGCAEGQALAALPNDRRGFKYVGIDSSQSLLQAAQTRNPDGEYRQMPDDGRIPAQDGEFDYVVVLGVLHHVPNVSHYLAELVRVLRPGGRLILREPNHAMGRPVGSHQKLPGLSPNERGIPAEFLRQQLTRLGLRVVALRPAYHGAVLQWLNRRPPRSPVGWQMAVSLDRVLNAVTRWNDHYDRPQLWHKLAATATYVVADK
jgi:2-polyprenyl-3-methyl-5-hydroxy-6-metoxy-1,4-benzoquinol methylase